MAATPTDLRLRRSAAQLDALARVEPHIRAADRIGKHKYLRELAEAFSSYHSVLSGPELHGALAAADILLVGDYHALASCQRYCARLLAERAAASERPLVLGVEAIFARDQHILDEWQRGEIDEHELRERIRYDLDWQYDWTPFYALLQTARAHGAAIYALDCMPRDDMRKIAVRDQHAAQKIAETRARHREAQIVVLFGESHLAPSHLPGEVTALLPQERVLTVLQNLDQLYWSAAGELEAPVEAVRVSETAICVFDATPLEKYESYRLYIERWRCERASPDDLAPIFYNLIDTLLRFLGVDKYKGVAGGAAIVDQLPEVYTRRSEESFRKLLVRKRALPRELGAVMDELRDEGCCYVPRLNAIFAQRLNMRRSAEVAAEFVQRACQARVGSGTELPLPAGEAADAFYARVLDQAMVYLGARVLYPARPPVREADYYVLYSQSREAAERSSHCTYREYLAMIDVLLLHKDYEQHRDEYGPPPPQIAEAVQSSGPRFRFLTRELGLMLGTELYDAYVAARVGKRTLRSLFCRTDAEDAAKLYFRLAQRAAKRPPMMVA